MSSWDSWLEAERRRREQSALERRLQVTERPAEPIAYRSGRRLVNLSSNNYLGLAGHPRLIEAAAAGAARERRLGLLAPGGGKRSRDRRAGGEDRRLQGLARRRCSSAAATWRT